MENLDTVESEGKAFRIQNKRLLITYKGHISKEKLRQFFSEGKKAVRVEVAHEEGDSIAPYPHTHVYVDFGRLFASQNRGIFDIDGIHPYIQKITQQKKEEAVLDWLAKQDPENKHLIKELTVVNVVTGQANSSHETVSTGSGIEIEGFLPWQRELKLLIDGPGNTRKIFWYFDKEGGKGKTTFAKWLKHYYSTRVVILGTLTKINEIMIDLKDGIDRGWKGEVLIIDLPRDEEKKSIYSILNALKDGNIRKERKRIEWDGKIVIVFAYFSPNTDELSRHLWDIRELTLDQKGRFIAKKHNYEEYSVRIHQHAKQEMEGERKERHTQQELEDEDKQRLREAQAENKSIEKRKRFNEEDQSRD